MVFLILLAPSADQQGPPWPPLSSACHWSPAQRWSRGPPHTVPSRFLSALPTLQHPARWPGSCPPSVHYGCTPGWVLPPHREELRKDSQQVQLGQLFDFSLLRILYINLYLFYLLTSLLWRTFSPLCQDQPPEWSLSCNEGRIGFQINWVLCLVCWVCWVLCLVSGVDQVPICTD